MSFYILKSVLFNKGINIFFCDFRHTCAFILADKLEADFDFLLNLNKLKLDSELITIVFVSLLKMVTLCGSVNMETLQQV